MPTALHPQTHPGARPTMAGRCRAKYGFPMKLRMPTKLGYKNPKHIVEIFVTNDVPGRLLGRPGLQLVRRLLEAGGASRPRIDPRGRL